MTGFWRYIIRRPVFILLTIAFLFSLVKTAIPAAPRSLFIFSEGKTVTFEGTVTAVKVKESYTAFTVKTGREKVLVRLSMPQEEIRDNAYDFVGRRIRITGKISIPDGRRNPKGFDYRRYLKGKGIYTICDTNKYKIKALKIVRPFSNLISNAKAGFYKASEKYFEGQNFGVSAGILFGETSYIDEEYYESFQSNGIAHILAVSGLHVNMTYDLVSRIFKKKRNIITDILSIGAVLL